MQAPAENHEVNGSRRAGGLAFSCIITGIQVIVVALRVYTRKYIVNSLGWDDYCIVMATLFAIPVLVINILQYSLGLGDHIQNVPPENLVPLLKLVFLVVPFYPAALGFTKLSILAFYWRVFAAVDLIRKICVVTAIIIASATIAFTFAFIFQVIPIRQFWTVEAIPGAKKIDVLALWYFVCTFNVVTDFFILLMPIPTLVKIRIPRLQKTLGVIALSLGGISCGAAIFRFYELAKFFSDEADFMDWTYTTVWKSISSELEFCLAAIAASLPAIKPLINGKISELRSIASGSRQRTSPINEMRSLHSGSDRQKSSTKDENSIQVTPESPGNTEDIASNPVSRGHDFDCEKQENNHPSLNQSSDIG